MPRLKWYRFGIEIARGRLIVNFWRWSWSFGQS